MNKTDVIDSLKEIIKPYIQDETGFQNLTEETKFIDDLKINSANLIDIVIDVEDKFDIHIEDDAIESMLTVKGAMATIMEKISTK